jgi:hypothetical protein
VNLVMVYATYYENIIVKIETKKSPMELMFNEKVKGLQKFRRFGKICVVTTMAKIHSKLREQFVLLWGIL